MKQKAAKMCLTVCDGTKPFFLTSTATNALQGTDATTGCLTDYIHFAGGIKKDDTATADRYCGGSFSAKAESVSATVCCKLGNVFLYNHITF